MEQGDITRAGATGWPVGAEMENRDTLAARREFAREEFEAFLDFALDGAPGLLENFIGHYGWRYRSWLN